MLLCFRGGRKREIKSKNGTLMWKSSDFYPTELSNYTHVQDETDYKHCIEID